MTELKIISQGSKGVQPASVVLSEAFKADPTITYLLNSLPKEQRLTYLPHYFSVLLSSAALNNASFEGIASQDEIWESCGVLIPPGDQVGGGMVKNIRAGFLGVFAKLGRDGYQRMTDLTRLTKACKLKYLKPREKYYYVFFLGTLESARGKGMCSRIVRHYQEVARKEGVTIWIEAATEYCRMLYERLGFETLEELRVGVGRADKGGDACVGGEGFCIWAMVWKPEKDGV